MATLNLQPGSTGKDTYIFQGDPTFNFGANTWFTAGGWAAPNNYINKALIQFDLSAIPVGSTITSATLRLYCVLEQSSADANIAVHRGLVDWFEGVSVSAAPGAGVDASVWNNRNANGPVAWAGAAGGVAGTEYASSATATTLITGTGVYFDWNVTVDVTGFVAGTFTNRGWWLIGTIGTDTAKIFRSSDTSTSSLRPELIIVYTPGPIISSAVTAVGTTVAPTVILGSKVVSPAPITARGLTVNPTVSASFTPATTPASGVGVTLFTNTIVGSVVITPPAVTSRGSTLFGGFALSLPSVSGRGLTVNPTITVITYVQPDPVTVWGQTTMRPPLVIRPRPQGKNPMPLLYLTDGTFTNGVPNRLNLISKKNGFCLENWRPSVAQYKDGGVFYDSPVAEGRRPIMHRFQNGSETFNLKAQTHNQNKMIEFIRELHNWIERAIEFWESPWAGLPVYLVARSPYETNTRYAVVYKADFPDVDDPYHQPFFTGYTHTVLNELMVNLERGHWLDNPPGVTTSVAVGNLDEWTWQAAVSVISGLTGQIYSLVQADDGTILAGSSDAAKIYKSSNDGQTWTLAQMLGTGSAWVRDMTKDVSGNLYAAVGNSTDGINGVYKSTNNGSSWTRVHIPPAGSQGYSGIVTDIHGYIYAVGPKFSTGDPINAILSYSQDQGVTWTNKALVGGSASNNHAAIIAGIGYFGANNQYQQAVRSKSAAIFNPLPVSPQTMYPTNFGGSVGLDIEAYQYDQTQLEDINGRIIQYGGTQREILRAVLQGSDSKIWSANHEESQNGQFQFSLRSTISGQTLGVLYADPYDFIVNPGSGNRTIWAGANGKIYKSTNRGYSWQLVSSTPTGTVTALLRTNTGRLLAGSTSEVTSVFTVFPFSTVQKTMNTGQVDGYAGAFVSNKSNLSNLTHVKVFDASGATYTDILPATSFPVNLFPPTPAAGDILYLGAQSTGFSDLDVGPFHSLVFDIDTQAAGLTITWEYWNGSAWTGVNTPQDNTDLFQKAGIQTFHWTPDTNWTTTSVNGVTGWWIRARVTAVSSPVAPTQIDQDIYTVTTPYIEISQAEIDGDIPALMKLDLTNAAATIGSRTIRSCMVGLRSVDRGQNFNAFLNCSDLQEPFGVTQQARQGTYVTVPYTSTGRVLAINSPTTLNTWLDYMEFSLSTTVARDYYGRYRVFVRALQHTGTAGQFKLRVKNVFGGSLDTVTFSKEVATKATTIPGSVFHLMDMGLLNIAASHIIGGSEIADVNLVTIQGYCTSNTPTLYLCDLVLIPVDEWAAYVSGSAVTIGEHIEIDSARHFKTTIQGLVKTPNDQITAIMEIIAGSQAKLQVRRQQRIWVLSGHTLSDQLVSRVEDVQKVQISKVQRYLSMRGIH